MYVVCFYWQGERWQQAQNLSENQSKRGRLVDSQLVSTYVNNLYYGVKRFANQLFKFVCFTNESIPDLDSGIETREFLIHTKIGVLPRLYMFSKDAGLFGHQVLCLDLDIVITGKLDTLMNYRGRFCSRSSFANPDKIDGDVMSFQAGKLTELLFWNPFIFDKEWAIEYTQGQERKWMQLIADDWADRWTTPGEIVSYRRHAKDWKDEVPKGVSIVSFHGHPRPHQVEREWLKRYWPYSNRGNEEEMSLLQPISHKIVPQVDTIYHSKKEPFKTKKIKLQ